MTRWEVTKAVRASDLAAPSRLIMLTLADVAEVGTAEIPARFTPSLRVLAKETGLNESTVTRHLVVLERDGWVVRTRPDPVAARVNAERTRYRLTVPEGVDAEDTHEGAESIQPHAEDTQAGCTEHPNKEEVRSRSDQSQITSSPRKRGTRIPPDFRPDDDLVTWAQKKVPQLAGKRETEKFVDYWTAASGRNAVKLDWRAAWRVWMRNAAERYPTNGTRSSHELPASSAPVPLSADEQCPEHRGQRKGRCRYCAADAKAKGAK